MIVFIVVPLKLYNSSLFYTKYTPENTMISLYNALFGVLRNGPCYIESCYKGTI